MITQVILYGIPNCDSIKKAKVWLKAQDIEFEFHDYRKQGLDNKLLHSLIADLGWESMLNRRGTTWRALSTEIKEQIDADSAMQIMLDNPAIIKRPILACKSQFHLGFNSQQYQEIFQ